MTTSIHLRGTMLSFCMQGLLRTTARGEANSVTACNAAEIARFCEARDFEVENRAVWTIDRKERETPESSEAGLASHQIVMYSKSETSGEGS
mmetsp:Transcript_93375/g.204347  ORF Transcript_93375/g.204347 Transcript_93375/m.204347 type:complete len:92 (+) Transcript_93375:326-601(+)